MEKFGNVSFSHIGGEIKCQQFGIKNNNKKEYELDSSKIYYTVFFNCDGKWKCPYKDRKINANIYDINLLPKMSRNRLTLILYQNNEISPFYEK
jgi:hypothetical protein